MWMEGGLIGRAGPSAPSHVAGVSRPERDPAPVPHLKETARAVQERWRRLQLVLRIPVLNVSFWIKTPRKNACCQWTEYGCLWFLMPKLAKFISHFKVGFFAISLYRMVFNLTVRILSQFILNSVQLKHCFLRDDFGVAKINKRQAITATTKRKGDFINRGS